MRPHLPALLLIASLLAACADAADCASGLCVGLTCRDSDARPDSPRDAGEDAATIPDAAPGEDAAPGDAAPPEDAAPTPEDADQASDAAPTEDAALTEDAAAPAPVRCDAISAHNGWQLCEATPDSCTAVFTDGAGCAALCEAAGLRCGETAEDLAGACAPDTSRPSLTCAPASGHQSDWCRCVRTDCEPACAAGERCVDQRCEPSPVDLGCDALPYSPEALLAELEGFGRRATGGDPARLYRVTTRSDGGAGSLRAALESDQPWWIVFDVEGTFTFTTPIQPRSNKTVDGRGRDVTLRGAIEIRDQRNIILTDLKLTNDLEGHCTQDGDVLLARGSGTDDPAAFTTRDLWFHHLELFNGGDGLLDLRGASRVTVSWSHLHTHKKAMLMGLDASNRETPGMQVTMHHNFFDRITLRGPQLLFGKLHYYNNYQYQWYEYGAGSLGGAQLYSEANIFESRPGVFCTSSCEDPNPCGDQDFINSKKAIVNEWDTNGVGYVQSQREWRVNGDEEITLHEPARVFDPDEHYLSQPDTADDTLRQRIRAEAGPRTGYCR